MLYADDGSSPLPHACNFRPLIGVPSTVVYHKDYVQNLPNVDELLLVVFVLFIDIMAVSSNIYCTEGQQYTRQSPYCKRPQHYS